MLFVGCAQKADPKIDIIVADKNITTEIVKEKKIPKKKYYPAPPKKKIKLKKVKDDNFENEYMYPEDKKKKKKPTVAKVEIKKDTAPMTRTECLSMIGQEKFDKYTTMFGSEASTLKRCSILKAMKS